MHKLYLSLGTLLAGLAVALGAFGAHGLKKIVPPETVGTFQTGVQYQMYHAFALIALAIIFEKIPTRLMEWSGICFCVGVLLFSGSLYLLTFLKATGKVGMEGLGMITPFGGLLFIAGWILFFIGILKK